MMKQEKTKLMSRQMGTAMQNMIAANVKRNPVHIGGVWSQSDVIDMPRIWTFEVLILVLSFKGEREKRMRDCHNNN